MRRYPLRVEHYKITKLGDDKFHIDGFPDAVAAISISAIVPELARELADMALHQSDLRFAQDCLNLLQATPGPKTVREALWQSAIAQYCKCFDEKSKARSTALKMRKILDAGLARDNHRYFITLRNKHLAHDENPYAQALPAAVVAPPTKGYRVEKVVVTTFRTNTLNDAAYGGMSLLVKSALDWANARFDELCALITEELEKRDYQDLLSQPGITYRAPTFEEFDSPRQ